MNRLSYLLPLAYIRGIRSEKNISLMLIICFIAIFASALALALIASVMKGFEKVTYQKLQGIHAQLIIQSETREGLRGDKIQEVLYEEFPQVIAASPITYKQIMLQNPRSQEISGAVVIKCIDPLAEQQATVIAEKMSQKITPDASFADLLADHQIIIGKKLAEQLDLHVGDWVSLLFIQGEKSVSKKISLSSHEALISGTFHTGIEEFDAGLLYGSLSLLKEIFPDEGIQQINIKLRPDANESAVIAQLKERFHLSVFSWKDLYTPLVAALKLEKYAMVFILLLISIIALMNIISLIFMQILQKKGDIAILLSMGMPHKIIKRIFMSIGVIIAIIACICGLLSAYGIGLILQQYPFITLPDTYYTSHLPIDMELSVFILIFFVIVAMTSLASWIPARNIQSIHAAQVLRSER